MPEFSLTDPNGTVFRYRHDQARVLGLVILRPQQMNLTRLVADMETLAAKLGLEASAFDGIGVMSGPGSVEFLRRRDADARDAFRILADPNFALWGKLGVIAAPTAIVVGADHKIQWVKAGYGYDFVAGLHAQLEKALGLGGGTGAAVRVETLNNASSRARHDRHIQLARAMAKKGRLDAAAAELEKLRQLDPNAVDVALELGEVLCRAGKNEAALKIVAEVKVESNRDKAHALLIGGWARRQMADLAAAESLLTKALDLERESPRILYELGKVHQARGDTDKALACYHRALAGVFGDMDTDSRSQK